MVIATAALGLVIGLVIGGLGGGGGALTVPALVYLLGLTAQDATTSSVLIVGISSLAGAAVRIRDVRWRTGLSFAAVGVPAAYLGSVLNHRVGEPVVLVTFAVVTVVAAVAMLVESRTAGGTEECVETPGPTARPAGPARSSPPGRASSGAGCSSGSAPSSAAEPQSVSSPVFSASAVASWSFRSWSSPCGCPSPPRSGPRC